MGNSIYACDEHMYKHSLFFTDKEEADCAEQIVRRVFEHAEDVDTLQDDDEQLTFEVRFYTPDKLGELDQVLLLTDTQPCSYAINSESV